MVFFEQLTQRELTVLSHLAEGLSNRRIASTLSITENTLEAHLRRIYRKLMVSNRTQASYWYVQHVKHAPRDES